MRKITSEACKMFEGGSKVFGPGTIYKSGNTKVVVNSNGAIYMELHGHQIAMIDTLGDLHVRSAGWETSTTKERLNGLIGVHVIQKAGQWYLNGEKWENSSEWTKIENN